jgi:hypothetical protein
MKKETLILLGIVGVGLYLYYRNKNKITTVTNNSTAINPSAPSNNTGVPSVIIPQTLDANAQILADNSYTAHFSLSGYKRLGNIPNTI